MTKHSSTVGGSTAGRVLACPASYELCKTMPEEPESPYAAEGTALHQAMEYALREGYESEVGDSQQLIGMEFYGRTITPAHIDECIEPALRQFDELYEDMGCDDHGVQYVLEKQVQFPGIPDAFGTADVILYTAQRAAILDWKFGAGVPVPVEENSSMMYYAMAALSTMDETLVRDDANWSDWPVELIIVQPRVVADTALRWAVKGQRLLDFKDDLVRAFGLATNPHPPYARGDHCRWCTAKPVCPMYKDVAESLNALVETGGSPVNGGGPNGFNQDDLAKWRETADVVTAWANSVYDLCHSEGLAGRPPTGMKMIDTLANTSWVSDDPKAIDRMLARFGLSLEERRKPWKNISPTQAEKELKKIGKKLKPKVKERLKGKPKLVDESHKSPPMINDDQKAAVTGAALLEMQEAH